MPGLSLSNIEALFLKVLRKMAKQRSVSDKVEHPQNLECLVEDAQKQSFVEVLSRMPNVGIDSDFERV